MLIVDAVLAAIDPLTLLMNFIGTFIGMIIGALPGLGGAG